MKSRIHDLLRFGFATTSAGLLVVAGTGLAFATDEGEASEANQHDSVIVETAEDIGEARTDFQEDMNDRLEDIRETLADLREDVPEAIAEEREEAVEARQEVVEMQEEVAEELAEDEVEHGELAEDEVEHGELAEEQGDLDEDRAIAAEAAQGAMNAARHTQTLQELEARYTALRAQHQSMETNTDTALWVSWHEGFAAAVMQLQADIENLEAYVDAM
jgi:chromosome segregation ATPase